MSGASTKAHKTFHPRIAAAWALGAVTAAAGLAGLWAKAAPESWLARRLPLSPPHEILANAHLDPARRPVDLDGAERETRKVLALSPARADAWVRLAYIETWRRGRLTPAAMANLTRSYEVAPLGPDVSAARITLVFESWEVATPEIRAQALAELAAVRRRDREAAHKLAAAITNPAGRLAIGMAIAASESEDALRDLR